jgi:tetratricopeptide (TPR) repeat protein
MNNIEKKIDILLNLFKSKKLEDAERFNNDLILKYPNIAYLYNILGLILTEQKKLNKAINTYKNGLKVDPNYSVIHNNLGSLYDIKGNFKDAEIHFKRSIKLDKKAFEPFNNLGILYSKNNNYKDSISCYKKAISLNKNFFQAYYNLGISYSNTGKFKEAETSYKKAIDLNPNLYSAHRSLSQILKYKEDTNHLLALNKSYEKKNITQQGKVEIAFALGKAYEDIKNYEKSFYFYDVGNNERRKNIIFSYTEEKFFYNNLKKTFNKEIYKKNTKVINPEKTPIFIVGMPRSGTTLIEQIISSHPKVFPGDELDFLPNLIGLNFDNFNKVNIKDFKKINLISKEYIKKLKIISNNSERVTDKLPINFQWIGLIKYMLPNAKIIHCIRDPRDNCFSIFKNYFVNPKLNFAYNIQELCDFYNLYSDLMNHWKKTIPNCVIDIKYEELIKNPESKIKSLIKSCDLDWNEQCLEYYKNERPIKTTSIVQARKKIYSSSINSWTNYNKYFEKSFKKLLY